MAILTATPFSTWSRITLSLPSAISEDISTPLLIGPGCMTRTSSFALASRSEFNPKNLAYSLRLGIRAPLFLSSKIETAHDPVFTHQLTLELRVLDEACVLREDADDGVQPVLQNHVAAENSWVQAEPVAPERVAGLGLRSMGA